jgi:hypothetical protein
MKTTMDIPDAELEEAMIFTKARTKRDAPTSVTARTPRMVTASTSAASKALNRSPSKSASSTARRCP